jgi:hypothetical protein
MNNIIVYTILLIIVMYVLKSNIEKFAIDIGTVSIPIIPPGGGDMTGPNKRNKARYIVIGNYKRPDLAIGAWSVIEIEAYDNNGMNVIKHKPVQRIMGEGLKTGGYGPEKTNDGIIFTAPTNMMSDNIANGYHGDDASILQALEYDLGAEYYIDQIVLHNRIYEKLSKDLSVSGRMNGTTIELFDANRKFLRIIQTGNWHNTYSKEYLL